MTLHRRTLLSLAALAPVAGLAQPAFPRKPVKIIVNFAVGGPLDVMARVLAENLGGRVGQPVIVENVTGANGNLGVQALLRAEPDGHTLLFTAENAITVSPHIYDNLGYDPLADMAPVSLVGAFEQVLTVPAASDIRSVEDFVRKSSRAQLSYASAGNGSPGHLAFLAFAERAGIQRHARAVSRQCAGRERPAGRPRGRSLRGDRRRAPAPAVRPAARAGGLRQGTLAGAARRADPGAGGLPGLQPLLRLRGHGAQGHAGAAGAPSGRTSCGSRSRTRASPNAFASSTHGSSTATAPPRASGSNRARPAGRRRWPKVP